MSTEKNGTQTNMHQKKQAQRQMGPVQVGPRKNCPDNCATELMDSREP